MYDETMSEPRIYMDHNATSPVRPEAARAVARALVRGGNPSSVHAEGRKARALIEDAREQVAALVGGQARNVIFTSGATEALNLALSPSLQAGNDKRPWRLFISATEHTAVLTGHRFAAADAETVPVGADGVIDLAALAHALDAHPASRPLVALQLANNESGVIQPVAEAAQLAHARGGLLVCDAVQAAGKIPVDMFVLGAGILVMSAHKIGGPSGSGALVFASDDIHVAAPMVRGGGQERGVRSGTENMLGIAGFAAAAMAATVGLEGEAHRLSDLRDRLESGLAGLGATIFGIGALRLPNTTFFAAPWIKAGTTLISLDLQGFAVSGGSACFSGKVKRSHVLEAMGVGPDIAEGILRVSLGWTTQKSDIEKLLEACQRLHSETAAGKTLAA